jgi:hypothetical protein
MPPRQFGEGIFGIGFRVAAQQFTIRCHFQPIAPGPAKTAQEIWNEDQFAVWKYKAI